MSGTFVSPLAVTRLNTKRDEDTSFTQGNRQNVQDIILKITNHSKNQENHNMNQKTQSRDVNTNMNQVLEGSNKNF